MRGISLSIVIPTWNRANILKKILHQLNNQLYNNEYFEVLVCDSFSSDNTKAVCQQYKNSKKYLLKFLNSKINNLSAKRNLGIKNSLSKKIIFLDDDCIPEKFFLIKYKKVLNDTHSIYSGIIKYPSEFLKNSKYLQYRQSRHFNDIKKKEIAPDKITVMNLGINLINFKKKIFFDERFTGYGFEDFEFAKRMVLNNYKLKTIDAIVIHYETSSNLDNYLKKIYFLSKVGVENLKQVNYSYYSETIYSKIDNNFIFKILIFLKIFKYLIFFLRLLLNYLEKKIIFKSFFIYRILILLSYLLGTYDRNIQKKINKKNWYE